MTVQGETILSSLRIGGWSKTVYTVKSTVRRIFISSILVRLFLKKVKVGMAISIWHLYHHAISYSALSCMFVDVMPLFNNGPYILIKFVRLIGKKI